jgi:hypothetical protein
MAEIRWIEKRRDLSVPAWSNIDRSVWGR